MAFNAEMQILKSIKKSKGWTDYKMADALGLTSTQLKHYEKLPISTRELMLIRLQELSGLSVEEFWAKLKSEAEIERSVRLKKKIDKLKGSK
jgi:transcriptional regulator with XRE-family HTH domain